MLAKRSLSLVGAALLWVLLVPLVSTTASAVVDAVLEPCCADCPSPASRTQSGEHRGAGPCKGDPLLICCDEQAAPARTQVAVDPRPAFLQLLGVAAVVESQPVLATASRSAAARDPVGWSSAQRLSVVLRI